MLDFNRKIILYLHRSSWPRGQAVKTPPFHGGIMGSNPVGVTTGTHAKGAYKTPPRVSFSMQNRGKLPFFMVVYPFCCFFAHRRGDLFFSGLKKSQPLNDCTKRIFAR